MKNKYRHTVNPPTQDPIGYRMEDAVSDAGDKGSDQFTTLYPDGATVTRMQDIGEQSNHPEDSAKSWLSSVQTPHPNPDLLAQRVKGPTQVTQDRDAATTVHFTEEGRKVVTPQEPPMSDLALYGQPAPRRKEGVITVNPQRRTVGHAPVSVVTKRHHVGSSIQLPISPSEPPDEELIGE